MKDYFDKIKPYLNILIDDHKPQGQWEIQLTMAINILFLKILKKRILYIQRVIA